MPDGVAAPGAAAQRKGGSELEVVQIADAALRGGGVDHDAAGFHLLGEAHELFALGVGVEVDLSLIHISHGRAHSRAPKKRRPPYRGW